MDLNDDALGLVLERVDSQVSLIRAAAVCRRWRRTIADDAFLRRFRSLHAPAVAGDYHSRPRSALVVATRTGDGPRSGFVPSSPPVADARHFALDFLPDGGKDWTVADSRGSLLMMCRREIGAVLGFPADQLVCEPLTRRYRRIPLPPDLDSRCEFYSSYLVDGGGDMAGGGVISMSNFRVVCMLYRGGAARAAVFRAGEAADSSWTERAIDDHILEMNCYAFHLGRAGGSWYLYHAQRRTLIILDGRTGEFSASELTVVDENWSSTLCSLNSAVTEGRDGEPRILFMAEEGIVNLFARINGGEWALEKRVVLSEIACGLPGYEPLFAGNLFVMTKGVGPITFSLLFGETWFFSLDLATMEATPVSEYMGDMMYRCELPWPPALHACLDI